MLSKSKSKLIEKKEILLAPELVPPKAVRLKFCKVGTLQYISHLDLQRTFNRIIVRACIPVWYTQGFNPHIKLVFSTPLSVGSESICEYLDIKLGCFGGIVTDVSALARCAGCLGNVSARSRSRGL